MPVNRGLRFYFSFAVIFISVTTGYNRFSYDKYKLNKDVTDDNDVTDENDENSGEDLYSMAERNRDTHLDYRASKEIFKIYPGKQETKGKKTVDDCTYTFVVTHPKVPACMKRENANDSKKRQEELIQLEARMIARDAYTRKEIANMRTRILVEQSGMQYMKHNMRVQSDEQVTLREKYETLRQDMTLMYETMLDLRKKLRHLRDSEGERNARVSAEGKPWSQNDGNKGGNGTRGINTTGQKVAKEAEYGANETKEISIENPAEMTDSDSRNANCRKPHKVFQNHCYVYVRERRNWQQAQTHCVKLGGNLLAIESRAEQRFVESFLKGINAKRDSYWVYAGGKKPAGNKNWSWISDTRPIAEPTFWFSSIIAGRDRGTACMFLILLHPQRYAWWTRDRCHYLMPSVCETLI